MNARQKRTRERRLRKMQEEKKKALMQAAILEAKRWTEEARRLKVQAAWDERREFRRVRALNTPKTSTGEW